MAQKPPQHQGSPRGFPSGRADADAMAIIFRID